MKNKKTYIIGILIFSQLLGVNVAFSKTVFESFIVHEAYKKELTGLQPGEQFGSAFAYGDFNNNRIPDLVISSPLSSEMEKEWNGAVYISFDGGSSTSIIYGKSAGEQLGRALTTGDFNGDGVDDLAIGAHNALDLDANVGRVYMLYGANKLENKELKVLDLQSITGKTAGSMFGLSLAAKDINNDAIDDLLVGAPLDGKGMVYGYLGSTSELSLKNELTIYGNISKESFGSEIEIGDFNGDGYQDYAIGAYKANSADANQGGRVYVYFGEEGFRNTIYTADKIIEGALQGGWFGFTMESGDLNADGYTDLAISNFPFWSHFEHSKVNILYGKSDFLSGAEVIQDKEANFDITIKDPPKDLILASDLLFADMNGDGKKDIVLGAPGVSLKKNLNEGDVYIILSQFEPVYELKNGGYSIVIHGEKQDDWFGSRLTSFDYNNDGTNDLIISAIYADSGQGVDNGKVYIVNGQRKQNIGIRKVVADNKIAIRRGELIRQIVNEFKLAELRKSEMDNCYEYKEFCLFNFMAMSSYDGIKLTPELILYPDVLPGDEYYEEITLGTLLGFVNGYMNDKDSPFHPDKPVTRIQALKMVLSSMNFVSSKYRFELISELGSYEQLTSQESYFADVDARIDHMWWYPRYTKFAVENGIIDDTVYFRPDENITREELMDLIKRTQEFILKNEKTGS